jgi:hypothetical protein
VASQQEAPREATALRPQQTHQLISSVHLEHICFPARQMFFFNLFSLFFSLLFIRLCNCHACLIWGRDRWHTPIVVSVFHSFFFFLAWLQSAGCKYRYIYMV